jgi:amino acid adenylation domain-containing protein
MVERQAARSPQAPALCDGLTTVTYAALMHRASRYAWALHRRGVARGDLVAACLNRSTDLIVATLGILQAGAAYVPIDPHGPAERRHFMLQDSKPRAIVTSDAWIGTIPDEFRERVFTLESLDEGAEPLAADGPLPQEGTPEDIAYVMYTSGSTGTPKGVLSQHDGAANHIAGIAEMLPLSADDRILAKTPPLFDVSIWEWFWPMSQGACLVMAPPGCERDPSCLVDAIESAAITHVHLVPTLLRLLLDRRDLERCRSLRRVICSGETLPGDLRDRFFERMIHHPALINLYGPTETAVHVTGWVCTPGEMGRVPIGRPFPNVRTYIVDDEMNAVPEGVAGELVIGGVQVARGYLERVALTRERFVPDPFVDDPTARCYRTGDRAAWRADGAIDFLGRNDNQVQLGGIRVELGELEAALRRYPAVADAAIVAHDHECVPRLVAYLRRANAAGSEPSIAEVRQFLADLLPEFMTPSRYVWLDDFPMTTTGKLDRLALPTLDPARPVLEQPFEPPRRGTEEHLARIWRDELELARVGRHDDFHLLGGDSLGALRMLAEVERATGVELPPSELSRSPTIALLARRVDASRQQVPTTLVTVREGRGSEGLYLAPSLGGGLRHWQDVACALAPDRPVHGFTLPATAEATTSVRDLVAILVRDLIAFQPEGPYHLAGYSFGGAVAFEMAHQLRACGRQVGVLSMIDYGPGVPGWRARARSVGYFIQNLPYWLRYDILQAGWGSVATRVWRKMLALGSGLGHTKERQSAERALNQMFHDNLPAEYRKLVIERLAALYRYEPPIYDGRILLLWARCRPLFHSLAPTLGWERYAAGGVTRIVVRCNHDNILQPPHAGVVAAALERALDEQHRTR